MKLTHQSRGYRRHLSWLLLLLITNAWALPPPPIPVPNPPTIPARSYILLEPQSGRVLVDHNADERVEPASITKLMSAYVIFELLKANQLHIDDKVFVSEKAWRTPGSRSFIKVNSQVDVDTLITGMIVQSGNDATVALAEQAAGSEDAFASLMNHYAQQLGLKNSHFVNSTGLPDPQHYMTARDITTLMSALIRQFPDYYHRWYSVRSFVYNGITQPNRNRLLARDPRVDGGKTGHTETAGYCLVVSGKDENMRLISVVMGTDSDNTRTNASEALLNYGFRFFRTYRLYEAGKTLTQSPVYKGAAEQVALGIKQDLFVTIPNGQYNNLKAAMDVQKPLIAPLSPQQPVGKIRVTLNDQAVAERSLYPVQPVPIGSWWRQLMDSALLYVHG
jgi:D-alanyl-D-alanine carboxypeptidase (penicillin-binding protein 5/6)